MLNVFKSLELENYCCATFLSEDQIVRAVLFHSCIFACAEHFAPNSFIMTPLVFISTAQTDHCLPKPTVLAKNSSKTAHSWRENQQFNTILRRIFLNPLILLINESKISKSLMLESFVFAYTGLENILTTVQFSYSGQIYRERLSFQWWHVSTFSFTGVSTPSHGLATLNHQLRWMIASAVF